MADSTAVATAGSDLSFRRLGVAPHRLLFFAGTTNILLAMAWWAAWLTSTRWPELFVMKYPPVYAGWLHAFVMQYQMLPSFIFGFLLTTFPKWTKQPEMRIRKYVPVGVALIAGQLTTLVGALGFHSAVVVGVGFTVIGWSAALIALAPIVMREEGVTWHARARVSPRSRLDMLVCSRSPRSSSAAQQRGRWSPLSSARSASAR